MRYFFIEPSSVTGPVVSIPGAEAHHIKNVLRLKPGAALLLFNGTEACDYRALLIADGKKLCARIESAIAVHTESPLACEIIQGLGRGDHMDWMIQKTTELGVSRIRLFNAERTQSPLKRKQLEKKQQHWRGIAISACEQCGRALLPEIIFHADLNTAIASTRAVERLLLEFEGQPLHSLLRLSLIHI